MAIDRSLNGIAVKPSIQGSSLHRIDKQGTNDFSRFPKFCPQSQNVGPSRFLLPFPSLVRYSSLVRCHLKDWISVVLLFSFLRMQVVCCCGSVVHCDMDVSFANQDTRVVCRDSDESNKQNAAKPFAQREAAKSSNRSKCSCAKHRDKSAAAASKIEAAAKRGLINKLNPICGCGHRSCDEHGHHHLYWLTHGSVVPQSKIGLHNSVLLQSFVRSFAFTFYSNGFESRLKNAQPSSAPPDRLSLYGHWLI